MGKKESDLARRKAAECMALAARAHMEERSTVLMAMARSWMTLANQMDRLAGTRAKASPARATSRSR